MDIFLLGITVAMLLVAMIFFLKFWKVSRNRFFGFFASAFALFAFERTLSLMVYENVSHENYQNSPERGCIYLLRLLGFILIFIAIVDRNRRKIATKKSGLPL